MAAVKVQIELTINTDNREDREALTRLTEGLQNIFVSPPLSIDTPTPSVAPSSNSDFSPAEGLSSDSGAVSTQSPAPRATRAQILNAKRVIRRCSPRLRELVAAAASAYPPAAEFTLDDLADKITNEPNVRALTAALRAHPKAATDLVGALVSWRRNLSRPEKRIGMILFERVDEGESPARYRVAAAVPQALMELANPHRPTNPEDPTDSDESGPN